MRGCGAFTGDGVLECRRPHRGRTPGMKRGGPFPVTAVLASTALRSVSGTKGADPIGGDDRVGYGATESSTGADGNTGGRCAVQVISGCWCCRRSIKGGLRRVSVRPMGGAAIVPLFWGCSEFVIHLFSAEPVPVTKLVQ